MKKILTILCLLLVVSCGSFDINDPFGNKAKEEKEKLKKQIIEVALINAYYNYNILIQPSECRLYSGNSNPLYFTPEYSFKFLNDKKQYSIIIIGDSTMDISHRYPGWYDKNKTQVVAVAGNTMCDMVEQMKVINTLEPDIVIVATNGGNDILHGITESLTVNNAKLLSDRISERFPLAKQLFIGVHPTITDKNIIKKQLNGDVQSYILSKSSTWYYDPLPLFVGVCDICQPPSSYMLDNIHYNEIISFDLKSQVELIIGESF